MKYRDEILQPPLRLSAYKMEGKPKILWTNPKSEEIISFYPIFLCILQTLYSISDYIQQNCHFLVTTLYNLNLTCQHIQLKENLNYWKQTTNLKKFCTFILYFCVFMDFNCDVVKRNVHVCLGCTKTWNPGISTFCICDHLMYAFCIQTHPYYCMIYLSAWRSPWFYLAMFVSGIMSTHWGVDILFLLCPASHLVSRHFRQQFLSYLYQIWHAGLLGQ